MSAERISRRDFFKKTVPFLKDVSYAVGHVAVITAATGYAVDHAYSSNAEAARYNTRRRLVPDVYTHAWKNVYDKTETKNPQRLEDAERLEETAQKGSTLFKFSLPFAVPAALSLLHDISLMDKEEKAKQ